MTVFEGSVLLIVAFVAPVGVFVNRVFAKKDAKELRDMTEAAARLVAQTKTDLEANNKRIAEAAVQAKIDLEENNKKVAEAAARAAEDAKRGQEIAEASRVEAAKAAKEVALVVETTRKEVAHATAIVADVAKATASQVEKSSVTTLTKLDTLATTKQLDGGFDKLWMQIEKRVSEARAGGFDEGRRSILDEVDARIAQSLGTREQRSPEARTRASDAPGDLASATAKTVDAAKDANDLAKKKP